MLKKLTILCLLITSLCSFPLFANESGGYLKSLFINKEGLVLFRLTNPVSQRPKCANNVDWDYKFNLSQPHSQAFLKMLRMAEASSKAIKVGYGAEPDCGKGFPAIEVHYLYITDMYVSGNKNKGNYLTK